MVLNAGVLWVLGSLPPSFLGRSSIASGAQLAATPARTPSLPRCPSVTSTDTGSHRKALRGGEGDQAEF